MHSKKDKDIEHDENRDPITGTPGAHPVGTGLGATGGAVAGGAIGAMGGPVGAAIGIAAGAIAGGLAGKATAEHIDPTVEEEYWRENYASRPYVGEGEAYEAYEPGYRVGYENYERYQGRDFEEVEDELRKDYEQRVGEGGVDWDTARHASRDSWERAGSYPRDTGQGEATSGQSGHREANIPIESGSSDQGIEFPESESDRDAQIIGADFPRYEDESTAGARPRDIHQEGSRIDRGQQLAGDVRQHDTDAVAGSEFLGGEGESAGTSSPREMNRPPGSYPQTGAERLGEFPPDDTERRFGDYPPEDPEKLRDYPQTDTERPEDLEDYPLNDAGFDDDFPQGGRHGRF